MSVVNLTTDAVTARVLSRVALCRPLNSIVACLPMHANMVAMAKRPMTASQMAKRRWAKLDKAARAAVASNAARARWAKSTLTEDDRRAMMTELAKRPRKPRKPV